MAKKKREEDFDTETTFADMNVDGFRWYNPNKSKSKHAPVKVTRKEYWAMVKGAFLAMLPAICCIILSMLLVFLLAYLWLR